MRKVMNILLVFAFCVLLFHSGEACARRGENMREYFDEKAVTKVYIPGVTNSSGDDNVDVNEIKSRFEEALLNRKSHKFEIVTSEASADISIGVDVTEYFWTEKDPVDVVFPPLATAVDTAKAENYARMTADVIVTDAKNGRELWSESVQSTITDDTMTEEASYRRSIKRLTENFIKDLLKKPKR